MKIIYKPWGSDPTENPKGFPADYPRDSREVDDKTVAPEGWISVTHDEYRNLVSSSYAEVAEINSRLERESKDADAQKLDALKRLFDEAEVIDDAWTTATNAQKFDLARNTFKILRRIRGFILDQYRS
jgi:hypothetical protein